MHFSLLETVGNSMERDSAITEFAPAYTCSRQTVPESGHHGLVRCPAAESMGLSSTNQVVSSKIFLSA